MFQHLIKASLSNDAKTGTSNRNSKLAPKEYIDDGWGDVPIFDKHKQKQPQLHEPFAVEQPPIFGGGLRGQFQSQEQGVGIEMNVSQQVSEKVSQVLSVNQFGEEQHPMIISNFRSSNPINFHRTAIFRIHDAAADLKNKHQALLQFISSQSQQQHQFKEQLLLQLSKEMGRVGSMKEGEKQALQREVKARSSECMKLSKELAQCKVQLQSSRSIQRVSSKRLQQEKPCTKCRGMQLQLSRLRNDLVQNEQQLDKLLIDNEQLQQHIFDLQQKAAGIDLQVEKRVREKTRLTDLPPISPIREDKELIEQLQSQIATLQEKCLSLQQQLSSNEKQHKQRQQALLMKEQTILQKESALLRRQTAIKQAIAKLQYAKNENYQREHQLLVAEQNLSKKISDLRKKESQLSEWEAQLAEKNIRKKDNTLANQFPSNDPSFQQSVQDLNRSGESLKSFGRNQPLIQQKPSIDRNDHPNYYKMQTLNDQQTYRSRPQHDFVRERQNYATNERIHLKTEGRRFGESAYVPKGREQVNQIMNKKYNPQLSSYKDSRQASPYRNLQQPKRAPHHQYALPKPSPNHYRQISKNSKSSLSKGKIPSVYAQQAAQSRGVPRSNNNNNQLGGLGSKLQRLREEIKKEIDSIK